MRSIAGIGLGWIIARHVSGNSQIIVEAVLLNAMRGSEQYHAMKSSMAMPYARCDCGEPNVFKTDSFVWSKSGSRSTRFGALFGFDFDRFIGAGLLSRFR